MNQTLHSMMLTPEWSHRIEIASLPEGDTKVEFTASDQECRDLARRLKVIAIEALHAEIIVRHKRGGRAIYVSGMVHGRVTQPCSVTLTDTVQSIDEPFESWFADNESAVSLARVRQDRLIRYAEAEVPILEEHEDPEPIVDGKIDLGELAAQYFILAITQFPRSEGAVAEPLPKTNQATDLTQNPFAALKKWKDSRKRTDNH